MRLSSCVSIVMMRSCSSGESLSWESAFKYCQNLFIIEQSGFLTNCRDTSVIEAMIAKSSDEHPTVLSTCIMLVRCVADVSRGIPL